MWNIKEEELDEFRKTCRRRLSPEGATGFMLGTIIIDSLMMLFIIGALVKFGWGFYTTMFEKTLVSIELVLYGLQIIFLILYSFPKARYKFQKLQTLVVLLYAFQLGTITFTMLVLPGMTDYSIDRMTLICVGLLFIGAVIFHIVTTIDTFKQASEGAFSMDERSRSFFSETKGRMIKGSMIYISVLLIIIYFHNDYNFNTLILYVVGTILMYAVAIGAAEFQLLVYCRFKFKSFNMTWEENERERQKFRKYNKKNKSKSR
ncbi:hypothetical protein P9Z56_22340 [Bacillus cereus]|nr:hypothetical protein [Bacillus cereus]MEC2745063.1 hypothetical protein [Bacillus cereus]MEC2756724.1 hypothetical protein [Bacillus cereus]MEC2828959.1 hypothetical protein [Bacillus cereus]